MSQESIEKRFVQRMRALLVSLPYDMKVLFEAMSDDSLPIEARKAAAGAAIYCLAPSDPIPDSAGILGFVDDAVVVLLTLERFLALGGEEGAAYRQRFPDQFATLEQDLQLVREYLGDSMTWLSNRVDSRLHRARYKGKDTTAYVTEDDALEHLYNDGVIFTTDYEIGEEEAARLTSGEAVRQVFNRRRRVEEGRSA